MAKKKAPEKRATGNIIVPSWLTNQRWHLLLLTVVSLALYVNTLSNNYALDDSIVITENMFVEKGLKGISGIFSYDTFYGFFQVEGKDKLVSGGRYRPLTLALFAIERAFWGDSPLVGHLFNILYNALTVLAVYWFLLFAFNHKKESSALKAYSIAFFTALIFAAHPLHTEVVANIKGRDEIITLLCSMGGLALSLKIYRLRLKPFYHLLVGVLFLLALFSKENAITYLAVLPLAFWFFTQANIKAIFVHTLPLLVAIVVFLTIRTSILGADLGSASMELMNNPFLKFVNGRYISYNTGEWLATVIFTLGKYLQLLFFPHPLTHDYYPRHIPITTPQDIRFLLSFLAYLALGTFAVLRLPKKDPVSFAILYYLATLSIVSNLFFPIGTNMAERLMYMPSVGFALAVAILLYRTFPFGVFSTRHWSFYLLALVVIAFSVRTITRNLVWKDNFTLFTTDIETSPNSAKLRNAVGGELVVQANKERNEQKKMEMLLEAEGHLKEAIRIHPLYREAYHILGNCYNYQKKYEASIRAYLKALEIDPGYEDSENNLLLTYQMAGRYYGEEKGELNKSIQYLQQAATMDPDNFETNRLLGVAYGIVGQTGQAIKYFTKALEKEPNNPDVMYMLGGAYYNSGNAEKGQALHERAVEIDPEVLKRMGVQ